MYLIRENSKGGRSVYYGSNIQRIITIIFWSLWIAGLTYILTKPFKDVWDGNTNFSKLINFIPIFVFIIFIFIGIWLYSKELKMDKAKNLKKSGGGIIKKLKITGIDTYTSKGNVRYFYYAKAKEGDITYCSNAYDDGFIFGGTYKTQNKGGFSQLFKKGAKKIIEKGHKPAYREVDGKRITVGDSVDIYIDPEDENNYWMDIDFLFDK